MITRVLLVLFVCGVSSACELGSEPTAEQRTVGIIESSSMPSGFMVVTAPDTVAAGAPFDVTISTIGLHGCYEQDGADLTYDTRLAVITPFDVITTSVSGVPLGCPDVLLQLPRTVRLVFGQAGVATLRVSGRKVSGGVLSTATPATVEKQIIVR